MAYSGCTSVFRHHVASMEFASNKSFAGKKREREIANTFCLLLDMVAKLYEFEFKLETRRRRRKGRKRKEEEEK